MRTTNLLRRLHDSVAKTSEAYKRVERERAEQEKRAWASHRMLMRYARELHKERPGLAEHNAQGRLLPRDFEFKPWEDKVYGPYKEPSEPRLVRDSCDD